MRVFFKEKNFLGGFFTFTQSHNFLHCSWVLGVDNDGDGECMASEGYDECMVRKVAEGCGRLRKVNGLEVSNQNTRWVL